MNIVIRNRQRTKKLNPRLLRQMTAALLAELELPQAELGIHLVNAREMTRVNETFLQHEGSTDVITFDHAEKRKMESGKQKEIHGELFICIDDAILQAKEFKTSWQSEVMRYVVHGVLHLLGHDDHQPAARKKMKQAENLWMRRLARRFSLAQLAAAPKLAR